LREPSDRAAASVLDEDDEVAGRSGRVGDDADKGTETDETL